MRKNISKVLILALCLIMALGLIGCEKEVAPTEAVVPTKDTLVIASATEPPTLDPTNQTSLMSMQMTLLLYNRLFTLDDNVNVVPSLVDTYRNLSDTEWELTLKEEVKFHNGTDLTSEDVKATLDYAVTVEYAQPFIGMIDSVEIVDDYTFIIRTKMPSTALIPGLTQSTASILPSELLAEGHDFNAEPCGTGPYKFVSWTSGDNITFERFDDYFGGPAKIKNIKWRFIPEDSARTIALEAGEIDLLWSVPAIDVPTLESNPAIEITTSPGSVNLYFMNVTLEKPPFDNVLFRKAVSAAINRQSLVDAALNGYGNISIGSVPNGLPGENLENAVAYDVEQAKKYLTDSGVDPSTVEITLTCTDDTKRLVGAIIQSNLAEIGIKVELESQDYATFLEKESTGDYQAALGGTANNIALNFMNRVYHSSQIGAANFSRFNSPEIDALIEQGLATLDDGERMKITSEIEAKLNDLSVIIPLYQDVYIRAHNADLGGVKVNACYFTPYHEIFWEK